jgi:hypothetical protein
MANVRNDCTSPQDGPMPLQLHQSLLELQMLHLNP